MFFLLIMHENDCLWDCKHWELLILKVPKKQIAIFLQSDLDPYGLQKQPKWLKNGLSFKMIKVHFLIENCFMFKDMDWHFIL